MLYFVKYAHNQNDTPGDLSFDCEDDKTLIKEVKEFVMSGYRNATWATCELNDGRTLSIQNSHGDASLKYSQF